MLNYSNIRKSPKQFLSITSVTVEKFDELLPLFRTCWNDYILHYTLDGMERVRPYVASEKEFLPQIEHKLFFILSYEKNASLQEFFAAAFDTDQATCNKFVHILAPVLKTSLSQYAPKRNIEEVNFQEGESYLADARERPIQRDMYNQKPFYSGKKKRHTVKNMAFCSALGAILFLSPTVYGSVHDKRIAQKLNITQKNITLYLDLAYLNWTPNQTIELILPHKKPRNTKTEKRYLTIEQKEFNLKVSKIRVKIENVFAHVKTMRILKDTNRNNKKDFRDLIISTAAAL